MQSTYKVRPTECGSVQVSQRGPTQTALRDGRCGRRRVGRWQNADCPTHIGRGDHLRQICGGGIDRRHDLWQRLVAVRATKVDHRSMFDFRAEKKKKVSGTEAESKHVLTGKFCGICKDESGPGEGRGGRECSRMARPRARIN
jgi:hypothetical protein